MNQRPPEIHTGDATGGLIPYKNPAALFAYYCGVFSLIPVIGIMVGVPGFFLGIVGLRKRKENPVISGTIHAWIGIILGGLTTILWGGLLLLMLSAVMRAS